MAYFYEEFQTHIVDKDAHCHHKQISDELRPSTHFRFFETDISSQPKTTEKSYWECEYERSNVGTDSNWSDVQHIMAEYEIVENKI